MSSSTSSADSNISLRLRPSSSRGAYNDTWLRSKHSFSFSSYYDPKFVNYGCLRVLNEDRVTPGEGFPYHPHANAEIFSYVVKGSILHQDSMGNSETLKAGSVQFTSAGTGIQHSEFNASNKEGDNLHFLQIWVSPNRRGLTPAYSTRYFSESEKTNQLKLIVSKNGEAGKASVAELHARDKENSGEPSMPIRINNDIEVYASILSNEFSDGLEFAVQRGRKIYIHVIEDLEDFVHTKNQVGITVNGQALGAGDAAFIELQHQDRVGTIKIQGNHKQKNGKTEFLLFDIAEQ